MKVFQLQVREQLYKNTVFETQFNFLPFMSGNWDAV